MASTKNSLYLSDDLQSYLEQQCEVYGMGKSAFISMVLAMHRQQSVAMDGLSKIDMYLTRMEGIVNSNKKLDEAPRSDG